MGLIPITYRWDKYVLRKDVSLETVPKPEAVRPVEPGKKILPPPPRPPQDKEKAEPENRFFLEDFDSKPWVQHYRERRTLWRPRQSPSVLQHPSEILFLSYPGAPTEEPYLLRTMEEHYRCRVTQKHLSENDAQAVESALRLAAQDRYGLLVLGRSQLEWAGALLKEVTTPVFILPQAPKGKDFPKKILVPVDGTPFSYPALSQALILGEDFGAEIQIFEVGEKKEIALGKLIEKMAWKNLNHGFFKAKGDIPRTVAEFAESEGAEMIVMGTHGVSPGSTQIPPSVTLEVLRLSPLPLWVVHPEN